MKIICSKPNASGGYHDVGMTHRRLTGDYSTVRNFIRYGIPSDFYGNTLRLEVFYGQNIYRAPDKVMYVTVWELSQGGLRNSPNPVILHSYSSNSPMTFNRDQLVEDYIQQLIGGMDYKTMECMVYDTLKDNLSDYTDEQLITEVEEYNPELLEDVTPWELAQDP